MNGGDVQHEVMVWYLGISNVATDLQKQNYPVLNILPLSGVITEQQTGTSIKECLHCRIDRLPHATGNSGVFTSSCKDIVGDQFNIKAKVPYKIIEMKVTITGSDGTVLETGIAAQSTKVEVYRHRDQCTGERIEADPGSP